MASSGLDLAIVLVGFTAVGWWLDRRYGWYPAGTVTGALLGLVGGMTNFLRSALALSRQARAEDEAREDRRGDGA
jgi:F0F1-type ATP synthase assembly protein I